MINRSLSSARLLIVERDAGVKYLLADLLQQEGYFISQASSLAEAQALLEEQTYHLVLSDLFSATTEDRFVFVEHLRAAAFPTPVGLITGWHVAEEEISKRGFALLVRKPFDLTAFFSSIAAYLNVPLSPEEARQGQVVQALLNAGAAKDWKVVASLCTEEVSFFLPGNTSLSGTVSGMEAFCDYLDGALRYFPGLRNEEVVIYHRPYGIAARYCMRWHGLDGRPQQMVSSLLLEFTGERISRIGARTNDARLAAVVEQAEQSYL
ncbi:MAG TPA: hypothetical protein VH540_03295 [Ktedonobacterales bacterium]|jgi:CheY-like chemotaxis protein